MTATAFTAIAPFSVIVFRENKQPIIEIIVCLFILFLRNKINQLWYLIFHGK